MPSNPKSEYELIASWKEGDEKAFDQLFKLHFYKLLRFASRYIKDEELAKELAMDVMFKAWQKKDTLVDNKSLGPFLFHLLKGVMVDQYRKKGIQFLSADETPLEVVSSEQADDRINYSELKSIYQESLDCLSPQRRLVLEMRQEQGMSHQEIADELSISARTVNRHLTDAFHTVRNFVTKHGEVTLLFLFSISLF